MCIHYHYMANAANSSLRVHKRSIQSILSAIRAIHTLTFTETSLLNVPIVPVNGVK